MSKKNLDDAVLNALEKLADLAGTNTEAVRQIITLLQSQSKRIAALEKAVKKSKK